MYLLISAIIYFVVSPPIFKYLIKGIRFLLPMFAAYSVFATMFGIPFLEILIFLVRILFLSFFVIYFAVSLYLYRFMEDSQFLKSSSFTNGILIYLIATFIYLRKFVSYYNSVPKDENYKSRYISVLVAKLINAISDNWKNKNNIQYETEHLVSRFYLRPVFITKGNILGCIYLTILILTLSL